MPSRSWKRKEIYKRALKDVAWHREKLMGLPLYPPQIEAIQLVEKHIRERSGKVITVRSSRQTMKNECSAMIQARVLSLFKRKGGTYLRTAPTWRPQMVNSKMRLERFLATDPLTGGDYVKREGFIYQRGRAAIQFLSAEKTSSVVGATADIALDIDEAHKVDKGKFEEEFLPMTAFRNVPIIMWGVAADKQDLLYEYREFNRKSNPELNLQYPAHIWCELLPSYAEHYMERVSKLGPDHPVILTQYDLKDLDAVGGYLKEHHLVKMLDSSHHRIKAPLPAETYLIGIDIAGEEETSGDLLRAGADRRDSTVAVIASVDRSNRAYDQPLILIRDIYWWTGKALERQQEDLLSLLNLWKPAKAVVDARGVGEQLAGCLKRRFPGVTLYKADLNSVSEDCYLLLSFINNDRVKMFRNDDSPEYREFCRQARHAGYEILNHDRMRVVKPSPALHIDFIKALQNVIRGANSYSEPLFGCLEDEKDPPLSRGR